MARGDATYAHLGWDLGTAGDIDNDGYDDIIVGAFRYDDNEISHAYVWFGSGSGLGDDGTPSNADWTASAPVDNVENGHAFGSRVGTAGDVNGDTYDDVFVGAPLYDNGQTDEGAVFIWYGSDTGLGPDGTIGNEDWSAESNQEDAQLGGDPRSYVICGAASAGDVNGDGYDDFVAGSHYYNNSEVNEGIALLWLGSEFGLDPDGSRPVGDPTNADWTAESDQENAYLGFEFGESGDLNGDGFDDVLVSASLYNVTTPVTITSAGAVFAWFGSELGPIENGTPSNADWVAEGDQAAAYLGFSLDWAGDVNGDELTDVIAGAPYYDNPEDNEGRAFVYQGQPDPIAGLSAVSDSPTLLGELTTFTATITSGTMVSYTWQFGDEAMGVGRVVTHIYEVPGVYTATVTVSNSVSMDTALTTITVIPVNESPVANDDSDSVVAGGSVTTDVLSNDSDPDDPIIDLIVSIDTTPLYGIATVQPDGSITYQHDGSDTTSDSYVYQICDPDLACDTATVSITISSPENDIYLPLVLRD
jgi:hypothetical protein